MGWVVPGRATWIARKLVIVGLFLCSTYSSSGQGLRTVIEARDKIFSAESVGVTAIKRDPAGRYYILAKPANEICVYGPDGAPLAKIPNANSHGATIRYAVDIDVSPAGEVVVADRGSNAIEVFAPDGFLVSRTPVTAPTSVVALPDAQFAVTSLVSKRLVQVIDRNGKVVRSFGEPNDVAPPKPDDQLQKQALTDRGRISGDAGGGIYFAFTSLPDPTLWKYDRYGYVGYQTSLPENLFTPGQTLPNDRVEFTFGLSDTSLSQQTSGFVTFGSSSDVKFGGGVGTGFGEALRRGMGYGQAIQQQITQSPGAGGGPLGAMFSGEVSGQETNFQVGMGRMSGMGGRGRHMSLGPGMFGDQTTSQGGLLQYSSGNDNSSDDSSDSSPGSYSSQASGTTAELGMFGSPSFGTSAGTGGYGSMPGGPSLGMGGLPAAFVLGSGFNTIGFRPQGLGGGTFDHGPGSGFGAAGAKSGTAAPHGGFHGGRYRSNTATFTAQMKVNLGDLGRVSMSDKPAITAMAVDPETQEIWAGIGDTLVHFSRDGNPAGIYYLTMAGATPLKPTALLVESNRILIAGDPWGIFEFARPDKPASAPKAPKQRLNVVPQVTGPQ